jgi:hypothetical protein
VAKSSSKERAESQKEQEQKETGVEAIRYSQLVERYLLTHRYECFNLVKPWKCKTVDHTETHRK